MKLLPYLMPDKDRYGKPRYRVRVGRRKATIKGTPGTPEFLAAYTDAVARLKSTGVCKVKPARRVGAAPGTVGALALAYFAAEDGLRRLDPASQVRRRNQIEESLREPLRPGSTQLIADVPLKMFTSHHIMLIRDRAVAQGLKGKANNRRKYLSSMFGWAIEARLPGLPISVNPCRDARKVQYVSSGFYTWSVADVQKYMDRHPIGTMAHLALCLLLFLGARRQDACTLGPHNIRTVNVDGVEQKVMAYVPKKTLYRRAEESVKPILPPLMEAIKATPTGIKTFIVSSRGEPFTPAGFGNKMREWCNEAGLPECSAHGLKKAAATICAELGATDRMLMALFDWTSEKQANTYTAKANKAKLAAEAGKLLGAMAWRKIADENKTELGG